MENAAQAQQEKYIAVGRRKESVARVVIRRGAGRLLVNGLSYEKYFSLEKYRLVVKQPLVVTSALDKYDIVAKITGGGNSGQAGALRHAIARALVLIDPQAHALLKEHKFLTRDPRMKERKKYGQKGARKRFQWTKR